MRRSIKEMDKRLDERDQEIERLAKEVERLEKVNQMLLNSMVTEAHTKETKEIERLNNKLELINKIVEREFPPNEFITYKIKKILKGVDKE